MWVVLAVVFVGLVVAALLLVPKWLSSPDNGRPGPVDTSRTVPGRGQPPPTEQSIYGA
jgi:serine/threonine-protein kinase